MGTNERRLAVDRRLSALIKENIPRGFDDATWEKIRWELTQGFPEDWEKWLDRPRIYTILNQLGQIPLMEEFVKDGLHDISVPFRPCHLSHSIRTLKLSTRFQEIQKFVLSQPNELKFSEGVASRHFHVEDGDQHFERIKDRLGSGTWGVVDHVRFKSSSSLEFARKTIPRRQNYEASKEQMKVFKNELEILRKLNHHHLIRLCGSYTDLHSVGLLMTPVADCNLSDFLQRDSDTYEATKTRENLLRTFFGCMAAAVAYLHENKIRHKDIKPENILVKDDTVFLCNFGISRSWAVSGLKTTEGTADGTFLYRAPEVVGEERRNESSDIWSLGCVFISIWTVIKGNLVDEMEQFIRPEDDSYWSYHSQVQKVEAWLSRLEEKSYRDNTPRKWISEMMIVEYQDRITAERLVNMILQDCDYEDPLLRFVGLCCTAPSTRSAHVGSSSTLHDSLAFRRQTSRVSHETGSSGRSFHASSLAPTVDSEHSELKLDSLLSYPLASFEQTYSVDVTSCNIAMLRQSADRKMETAQLRQCQLVVLVRKALNYWETTRGLRLTGIDAKFSTRVFSFWLPMTYINLKPSSRQNRVDMSWSDCNQAQIRKHGGRYVYSRIHDPLKHNITISVEFSSPKDAKKFIDHIKYLPENSAEILQQTAIPHLEKEIARVYEFHSGYRGILIPSYDATNIHSTRLLYVGRDIDFKFLVSSADHVSLSLDFVLTPVYISNMTKDYSPQPSKDALWASTHLEQTSAEILFPKTKTNEENGLPQSLSLFLGSLTPWRLRSFQVVPELRKSRKHWTAEKIGEANVMLWQRQIDNIITTRLICRCKNVGNPLLTWLSATLQSSKNIDCKASLELQIKNIDVRLGRLLDVIEMAASDGGGRAGKLTFMKDVSLEMRFEDKLERNKFESLLLYDVISNRRNLSIGRADSSQTAFSQDSTRDSLGDQTSRTDS